MSAKVTDNTKKVNDDISVKASMFLRAFAESTVALSKPRTPKKLGFLRRDVLKQVLGLNGKIIWNKEYAAKMETVQFKNYTTPGTGPRYAEDAIKKNIKNTSSIAKGVGLT